MNAGDRIINKFPREPGLLKIFYQSPFLLINKFLTVILFLSGNEFDKIFSGPIESCWLVEK